MEFDIILKRLCCFSASNRPNFILWTADEEVWNIGGTKLTGLNPNTRRKISPRSTFFHQKNSRWTVLGL